MFHLVPSFHYDIIYLRSCAEYLNIGCGIIGKALDMLAHNEEYTFTIEQIFLVEEFCCRFPERIGELRKFANEKRLEFASGMYVMPDMNFCDGESMYQQVKYGRKFLRETVCIQEDVMPVSAWIADCWGHHAQLPQILTQCGYKSYFFMRCMRPDVLKKDFRWEGIDGTRINTSWLAGGYAGLHFSGECENKLELTFAGITPEAVNGLADKIHSFGNDAEEDVLLPNGGDNCFPQETACGAVAELNKSKILKDRIAFSTPANYIEQIAWEKKPVVNGEFCGIFEGSYTTNIQLKQRVFAAGRRLCGLEIFKSVMNKAQNFDSLWKKLLKLQFHDIIMGTICNAGLKEVRQDLDELEHELDAVSGTPAGIFNPVPRKRLCELSLANGKRISALMGPLEYRPMAECRTEHDEFEKIALPLKFHGAGFDCEIDQQGFVRSLQTGNGMELVNQTGPCPFGSVTMQIDRGDSWCNFEAPLNGGCDASNRCSVTPDPYERTAPGPLVFAATFQNRINSAEAFRFSDGRIEIRQQGQVDFWRIKASFTNTLTLKPDSPLLNYKIDFLPENGQDFRIRTVFPLNFTDGKITHAIPFGLQERPRAERPSSGLIHFSNGTQSLSLLTRGISAGNVDDQGNMMLTIFRAAAMEYKCESDLSYGIGIPHVFEYAILPGKTIEEAVASADDYHNPPFFCNGGTIDSSFTFPEWPGNIHLATMRRLKDGRCFIRLAECAGKSCEIHLPDRTEYANAMEEPSGRFISGGVLAVSPFQIVNLIME